MNRFSELARRVRAEPAESLLEANSSDNAIRCRSGFLRPASCTEPVKHCAFRSRQTRIGCTPGPSTINLSPREIAALTAATCVSPPITEMRWAFAWRVGQHFADEAVEPQLDAAGRLLRALYLGQPAESKVCVFHSDSFFS